MSKYQLTDTDIAMLPEYCRSWYRVYCQQRGYGEQLTYPQVEALFDFIMPISHDATVDGFTVFKQVIETDDFFLGYQFDEKIDALWHEVVKRIKQLATLSMI